MPKILVFIIIGIVLIVSFLMYVIYKLFLEASTDVSYQILNDIITDISKKTKPPTTIAQTTIAQTTIAQPTIANTTSAQTTSAKITSTSVVSEDTLEAWSEDNFQGDKLLNLSLEDLNDGYNIELKYGIKSIKFPSTGYDVYILTEAQFETASMSGDITTNYKNNSTKINPNSPSLSESFFYIIIIKNPQPTT